MIVFRIIKDTYKGDLSGTGAFLYGGRWNYPEYYMIYAAEHISLALVEILVHSRNRIGKYLLQTLEIPQHENIGKHIGLQKFPKNWSTNIDFTQEIGTDFLKEASLLYLTVPSVIIPQEKNIILNPKNPFFKKVKIISEKPFEIDKRLIK